MPLTFILKIIKMVCFLLCVYFTTISKGAAEGEILFGPGPVPLCASQDFLLWEPQNCVCGVYVAGVSFQRRQMLSFKKSAQFEGVKSNRRHWDSVGCSHVA